MKVSFVNDALKMALRTRNPQRGLIWIQIAVIKTILF